MLSCFGQQKDSHGIETDSVLTILSEPGMTVCRGVRAATVEADDRDQILRATRQMLALMIRRNGIEATDVASVMFTVTRDLTRVSRFGSPTAGLAGSAPALCLRVMFRLAATLHSNDASLEYRQGTVLQHTICMKRKLRPDLNVLPPLI